MEKVGFIIGSGYLLLSELDLALSKHIDDFKVAYILNHFIDSDKIYVNLKETGIFNKIFYLPVREYVTGNKYRAKQLFNARKWLKEHIPDYDYNSCFDKLYGGSQTELIYPLYQLAKKKNPKCEFYDVDDGCGIFCDYMDHYTFRSRLFCRLLRKHWVSKELAGVYMFWKDKYSGQSLYPILQLPDPIENSELFPCMNRIYEINKEKLAPFEQNRFFFLQTKGGYSKEDECCDIAREILGENLLVKPHPVTATGTEPVDAKLSMEVISLNCRLEEKVLIGVFSTGFFSCNMLFGKLPTIILLYKLTAKERNPKVKKWFDDSVKSYIDTFHCEDRVFVPETMEEYKKILHNCQEELRYEG